MVCSDSVTNSGHGVVQWLWNDRCTPSRGPFGALSFAAVSLYHRVCFAGAVYSRGLVETL